MQGPGDPHLHGAAAAILVPDHGHAALSGGVRAERHRVLRGGGGGVHGDAEFPDTVGLTAGDSVRSFGRSVDRSTLFWGAAEVCDGAVFCRRGAEAEGGTP